MEISSLSNSVAPSQKVLDAARRYSESGEQSAALDHLRDAVSLARGSGDEAQLKSTWQAAAKIVCNGGAGSVSLTAGKGSPRPGGGKGSPRPGGGKGSPRPGGSTGHPSSGGGKGSPRPRPK